MAKEQPPIPDDTTLQLTKEQWLAVKGILELFVGDNDAPFLEHHGRQVMNTMGGYTGLAFGGFDKYKEYSEWYQSRKGRNNEVE